MRYLFAGLREDYLRFMQQTGFKAYEVVHVQKIDQIYGYKDTVLFYDDAFYLVGFDQAKSIQFFGYIDNHDIRKVNIRI